MVMVARSATLGFHDRNRGDALNAGSLAGTCTSYSYASELAHSNLGQFRSVMKLSLSNGQLTLAPLMEGRVVARR
jgi:hypothetical protein